MPRTILVLNRSQFNISAGNLLPPKRHNLTCPCNYIWLYLLQLILLNLTVIFFILDVFLDLLIKFILLLWLCLLRLLLRDNVTTIFWSRFLFSGKTSKRSSNTLSRILLFKFNALFLDNELFLSGLGIFIRICNILRRTCYMGICFLLILIGISLGTQAPDSSCCFFNRSNILIRFIRSNFFFISLI